MKSQVLLARLIVLSIASCVCLAAPQSAQAMLIGIIGVDQAEYQDSTPLFVGFVAVGGAAVFGGVAAIQHGGFWADLGGGILASNEDTSIHSLMDELGIPAADAREFLLRAQLKATSGDAESFGQGLLGVHFNWDEVSEVLSAGDYSTEDLARVAKALR